MNVVIYTKNNCPNCTSAKNLLRAKNLPYVELNIEFNPALREDLPEDARQMPQVFINRQRVGGLAGLQAALKQLEL